MPANTRTALLQDITEWASNTDSKPIFWLSGMAGTGKSTIARTVAWSCAEADQLGASFFFKKGEGERSNASRFFSTIATDLLACEPGMLPNIRRALDDDSAIPERALKDQFEQLILRPLLDLQWVRSLTLTRIIVVDALDECDREEDIRAILQLLARAKDVQPVSLRILVTSRPELPICLGFKQMPNGTYQDFILHEVPRRTIEHDIRLFFEHELGAIREARFLSPNWPSTAQVESLVTLAVPLFIFAATVCRYVGTKDSDPEEYLNKVLQYQKSTFSQLDHAYSPVLEQLLTEQEDEDKETWLDAFRKLVGIIVVLRSPLSVISLANLLQIPQKQIEYRLDSLHSVLSVPTSKDIPIRPLHLSFREFLVDPRKQGVSPFWVDKKSIHKKLVTHCLELMSAPNGGLRQNICGLSNLGSLRSEIDEVTVASSLPPELQYACHYWVDHLECSQHTITDGDMTHLFLQKHLLHWLEAMSLTKEINQCVRLFEVLQALLEVRGLAKTWSPTSTSSAFLRDASRFVLRFHSVLSDAPLQIYSSALIFAPDISLVRQTFADQVTKCVEMLSHREADWDACRSTLEGHSASVRTVAFSLDGRLVVSASDDNTIRVWDVTKGTCRSILEGHSESITAVAFSPDGKLVVSTSNNKAVRAWYVAIGTYHSTLEGHSRYVTAVAFSPDGRLVVSASNDKTLRVWDVANGMCSSVLKGHSSNVRVVALSPDGQLVVSGSWDCTVRVWDAVNGTCRSTLQGHSDYVKAVAFSPDGQLVVSGSRDNTLRVWNALTGTCRSILKTCTDFNSTVAFSPDEQLIVSASDDKTVRVWDAVEGMCHSTLKGHVGYIEQLAFSPHCKLLHTDVGDIPFASSQAIRSAYILVQDQWISQGYKPFLWLPF